MKQFFSRYGGHGLMFGQGKASSLQLPEDQSFENMMDNHSFEMEGISYLSSYKLMPNFMGPYKKCAGKSIKVADIYHPFLEMFLQEDVDVNTAVYLSPTSFVNVFLVFIKTDFRPLKYCFGRISPSYDWVLTVMLHDKPKEVVQREMSNILHSLFCLLIFEMGLAGQDCSITPAKSSLGKKLDPARLEDMLGQMKDVKTTEELSKLLKF